jgi:hypothetical protein
MPLTSDFRIYKDKYMAEAEANSRSRGRIASGEKDKKPRSKSRTRSIFQRKKSIVPEA